MVSINFPNMFSTAKTNLIEGNKSTISNTRLLLASWKGSLFGDPYFGTNLKQFLFDQNSSVLRDLIIDDIYISLLTFIPQLAVQRNNIEVTSDGTDVYATINCINKLDNQPNMYQINLTTQEEE